MASLPTPPHAVLFDMDGVLVNVEKSYREAIIRTVAHFGVTVTQEDIASVKVSSHFQPISWLILQSG